VSARLEAALLELAQAIREELAEAAIAAPERLYDLPTAAATIGIGRTRLYAELDSGRLRSVKVGRRRLVPASAIAELLSPGTKRTPAQAKASVQEDRDASTTRHRAA
jgi:excisionase family DNA binding protein